jgi:hypothetical protein
MKICYVTPYRKSKAWSGPARCGLFCLVPTHSPKCASPGPRCLACRATASCHRLSFKYSRPVATLPTTTSFHFSIFRSRLTTRNNQCFMHIECSRELPQARYCSWTYHPPPPSLKSQFCCSIKKLYIVHSTASQPGSTFKFGRPDGVGYQWRRREDSRLMKIHGTALSSSIYTTACTLDTPAIPHTISHLRATQHISSSSQPFTQPPQTPS